MPSTTILLVGEDRVFSNSLIRMLQTEDVKLIETPDKANALRLFKNAAPVLVLVSSNKPAPRDGLDVCRQIRARDADTPLILISRFSSEARAIEALRTGVSDYFKFPLSYEELLHCIRKHSKLRSDKLQRRSQVKTPPIRARRRMIGLSRGIQQIRSHLIKVAPSDCTVLITGETGTGKGLVAWLIHHYSHRRDGPLVPVNCAAIPDGLIESELFGYDKGAFTGAGAPKRGKFEMAENGTIFLDEIGDMGLLAQAKILKTIEEKENYRLGAKVGRPLNVRVIAATNQDPEALLKDRKFRKDLFYRLNVARVHLPPLRDRKEDIPQFMTHYIDRFNHRYHKKVEGFTDEAVNLLLCYNWPGNVRELRNLTEACFINASGSMITPAEFPEEFRQKLQAKNIKEQNERDRLLAALLESDWNKTAAARRLNWSRMTLYRKINKYKLNLKEPSKRYAS